MNFLLESGLLQGTLDAFEVTVKTDERYGEHAVYPTYLPDGEPGESRAYWSRPVGGRSYSWAHDGSRARPLLYGLNHYREGQPLWLVDSEVAVWLAAQEGMSAVAMLAPFITGVHAAISQLVAAKVKELHILMPNSDSGRRIGALLAQSALKHGITALLHHWYATHGQTVPDYNAEDYARRCLAYGVSVGQQWESLEIATVDLLKEWSAVPQVALAPRADPTQGPVRVTHYDGAIYLDLADRQNTYVCLRGENTGSPPQLPYSFARFPTQHTMPYPIMHGDHNKTWQELRDFLKMDDNDSWKLLVGWLVSALRPNPNPHAPLPMPLLVVTGRFGKTTFMRMMKRLLDPTEHDVIAFNAVERVLLHGAKASRVLCIDNFGSRWSGVHDMLMAISTGETYLAASGAITLNLPCILAVNEVRGNRVMEQIKPYMLQIPAPKVTNGHFEATKEMWERWEELWPRLLGAICHAMTQGLKYSGAIRDEVRERDLPMNRFADWTQWVMACERGLPWDRGSFYPCYMRYCGTPFFSTEDCGRLIEAVRALLEKHGSPIDERPTKLVKMTYDVACQMDSKKNVDRDKSFPRQAVAFGRRMAIIKPVLAGLEKPILARARVEHGGLRYWNLSYMNEG